MQQGLLAGLCGLFVVLPGCVLLPPPVDRHGAEALEEQRFLRGAWLGAWPSDSNDAISDFEHSSGVRLDLVDIYLDWFTPVANVTHSLHHIAGQGSVAILTWEAQTLTTQDILTGTRDLPLRDGRRLALDDYLAEFATGVCTVTEQTEQPVLVRILHEMNGDWFAWGLSYQRDGERPNSPDSYRQAWVKIHDAFASRCGDDVRFVWAVNHFSKGEGADFTSAYPGDAFVDYVAIDGYNWGSNAPWGWQSFETLFHDAYCALVQHTEKPLLIAEIASTERGGDKAAWIEDVFNQLAAYDRIQGLVWFNHDKYEVEIGGTLDWPVDSSPTALTAFRDGLQAQEAGARHGADPC